MGKISLGKPSGDLAVSRRRKFLDDTSGLTSRSVHDGLYSAALLAALALAGCSGGGQSSSSAASNPTAPAASLAAKPTILQSGGTAMLTWSSSNVSACTGSGGWNGSEPTSGSVATAALTTTTSYSLTCSGGGASVSVSATVSVTNPGAFAVSPRNAALTLSQSQQFTAAVPGGGAATWSVDGIVGGSGTVGTISTSGLYVAPTNPGTHTVLATSVADPSTSGSASIAVTDLSGVYTFHNDLARTGQNLQEYALTPASVSGGSFGKLWSCPVDGDVYAQPLYVASLAIAGGVHNVAFVATEHDSVYAFDADNPGCVTYWHTSALTGSATTIPVTDIGQGCLDISTEYGITGTPVIDPASQTLYFVANTKNNGVWYQSLHRLALATGAEQVGSPVAIQASLVNNSGTTVSFSPLWENQRPALALTGGDVYIGWSAHCDLGDPNQSGNWWGWLMSYSAASLAQTAVFNSAPNGVDGGIWMSGSAPAVDSSGNLFFSTGNGTFDDSNVVLPPLAPNNDFGMSFLNLNATTLAVQDFYTPSQWQVWSNDDYDISASGVTALPDGAGPSGHPNLLVGFDKEAHLWLIDRSNMGGFSPALDNTVQLLTLPDTNNCSAFQQCIYAAPAYYNGSVYIGIIQGPVLALTLTDGLFSFNAQTNTAIAAAASAESYSYPGATPAISASPSGNAILWVLDNSGNGTNSAACCVQGAAPAVLRAYDATNLASTLYSSSTLAGDAAGNAVKFTVPVIANGHVYVGGSHQLTVYGLLP
jgi:hypothetical protein